jgi:NADP-dependent 3-hydroxy acid dehydrogenase YdfG
MDRDAISIELAGPARYFGVFWSVVLLAGAVGGIGWAMADAFAAAGASVPCLAAGERRVCALGVFFWEINKH